MLVLGDVNYFWNTKGLLVTQIQDLIQNHDGIETFQFIVCSDILFTFRLAIMIVLLLHFRYIKLRKRLANKEKVWEGMDFSCFFF